MSHEIERCLTVREPAWHGLGRTFDRPVSVDEALREAFPWYLTMEPWVLNSGLEQQKETVTCRDGVRRDREEFWAVVRRARISEEMSEAEALEARSTWDRVLGSVGRDWRPLQPFDAFDWFSDVIDGGLAEISACGSILGGKRIFICCLLKGSEGEVVKGDQVRNYLTLMDGYDGTISIQVGFSPIRVVCWNTVQMTLGYWERENARAKGLGGDGSGFVGARIRHGIGAERKLRMLSDAIDLSKRRFSLSLEAWQAMATARMPVGLCGTDTKRREYAEDYFATVFGGEGQRAQWETPTGRDLRAVKQCLGIWEASPTVDRDTVWGLYNTVTEYVTHEKGNGEDTRLASDWSDKGSSVRTRAANVALALV